MAEITTLTFNVSRSAVTLVVPIDCMTIYALGATKTDTSGVRREKPLKGEAVVALQAWLVVSQLHEGPLFRRLFRGGRVGGTALTGDQVARIV